MRAVLQRVLSARVEGLMSRKKHGEGVRYNECPFQGVIIHRSEAFSDGSNVDGQLVSSIGPGILVLVGLLDTDTEADAEYICRKLLNVRLFPNEKTGKGWDLSVMQKNYEVLLVSQFTLYGQLKGNKLDFHVAMPSDRAKPFYESLIKRVAQAYRADSVKDGVFGAMMQVHLVNDGPVTIQFDTQKPTTKESDQNSQTLAGKRYFVDVPKPESKSSQATR